MSRRPRARLTGRQLEAEINREVSSIQSTVPPVLPEGRCRVCQDPESRSRVNRLLAYGMKISEIEDFVEDLNARRSRTNQITYWSLLRHSERHFNLQDPANAAYRRILERRRAQVVEESGDAAATLLSGMAYLDIVAQKGFETLLAEDTVVDYETGLKAQLRLEEMQRDGALHEKIAQMRRDVSLLQQAVKDVVPDHLMAEIVARIDELKGTVPDDVLDGEVFGDDEDDDIGCDPVLTSDANDSLEDD